jgi:hypothetical protein
MPPVRCIDDLVDAALSGPHRSGGILASVRLPSCSAVAVYQPEIAEHQRRLGSETGAVRCTSTLSALWEMPAGISVPVDAIPTTVRGALLGSPGLVAQPAPGWARREFEPCGVVTELFCASRSADVALRNASLLSPIYSRWAVFMADVQAADLVRIVEIAEGCGVGAMVLTDDGVLELCSPAPPVLGQPHVFRWWMVEMAYASWLSRGAPMS